MSGITLLFASRASAVMVAVFDPSEGTCARLVSSVRLATVGGGGPAVPQLAANDGELQSVLESPPHAASASVRSAGSHLSLRILFT